MCHCLACQKRSGSVFAAQARFKSEDVTTKGASTTWHRAGDEGGGAIFHFCPTCGATVYYTLVDVPGFTAVAIGAFADPTFPAPKVSVYENRKHAWVVVPEGAERFA